MTEDHDTSRLTEREARRFLTLLERVENDLDQAFFEAADEVFSERCEDESASVEAKWGAPVSEIYVEGARHKLRQFAEHAYLTDDSNEWDVEIADVAEEQAAVANDPGLASETEEALDEFKALLAENPDVGKPMLQPPLRKEEIDAIDDERLRALAWDLDAIARAYNYASDPTIPDLAREDNGTWIDPSEQVQLEEACLLLRTSFESISRRVGTDLNSTNHKIKIIQLRMGFTPFVTAPTGN